MLLRASHLVWGSPTRNQLVTAGKEKRQVILLSQEDDVLEHPADQLIHQVAFGNRDYGIDTYYIDREAKNLYLYQFKWSEK